MTTQAPDGFEKAVTPQPVTPADVAEMESPPKPEELPPWALEAVPAGFQWPTDGRRVAILRLKGERCHNPKGGDHTAILWSLSVKDEKLAKARMRVTEDDSYEELAKQMVRAHDGQVTNWALPMAMPAWWDAIGPKHRNMLVSWYVRTHVMTDADRLDFFGSCVAFRSVT